MPRASFKNTILQKMSAKDFESLSPHFERIELSTRQVLLRRNDIIDYVYFPESCQASVLFKADAAEPIEVGIIGSEGMTDFALSGRTAGETIIQVGGEATRIRRAILQQAVEDSNPLALLTLRWHQALLAQVSFTALSHGGFTLVERLARFLLMLDDRTAGHEAPLVHEYFAWMLCVRRAGVTEGLQKLATQGAIETRRGKIIILDRDLLIQFSRGSYGPAEAEYDRIFGAHVPAGAARGLTEPVGSGQS